MEILNKTSRTYLRLFNEEDITAEYIAALNDKTIVGLTEARHRRWSVEQVQKYIQSARESDDIQLIGVFLQETNEHIGNLRLHSISSQHLRAELGILLHNQRYWSQGYGTESILAVTSYCFQNLGLHRVCADYYSLNYASAKMFEKAGFEKEGVFKDHFILGGEYVDSIRVAKLAPSDGSKSR